MVKAGFLRCFRGPIRVPRIENRVPRIRENRVPRIREIGSLQFHTGYFIIFLKKNLVKVITESLHYVSYFFCFGRCFFICVHTLYSKRASCCTLFTALWHFIQRRESLYRNVCLHLSQVFIKEFLTGRKLSICKMTTTTRVPLVQTVYSTPWPSTRLLVQWISQ